MVPKLREVSALGGYPCTGESCHNQSELPPVFELLTMRKTDVSTAQSVPNAAASASADTSLGSCPLSRADGASAAR